MHIGGLHIAFRPNLGMMLNFWKDWRPFQRKKIDVEVRHHLFLSCLPDSRDV